MSEQSLYEQEPVAAPSGEGDLFYDYEIKGWKPSPRLYKILSISAAVNVLAVVVFAQTSLLTMKGCDSPFVGRVCQVLDAVYVGTALFGTDRDYIDAVYDRTELGDAEITFVDVSGVTPPLSYPAGYFQIANPQPDYSTLGSVDDLEFTSGIPGIPSGIPITKPQGGTLFDTTPNIPNANPKVVDGGLPKGFDSTPIGPRPPRKSRAGRIAANPKPTPETAVVAGTPVTEDEGGDDVVEKPEPVAKADPVEPPNPYNINKRPFVDLAVTVNDLLDRNLVNLESPFVVSGNGKLTKEGRLEKSFRWDPMTSTDPRMPDVVKEAVEAVNDSGYLQYLSQLSGKDLNLMLQQDDLNITAVIQSTMESPTRANSIKSTLDLAISIAKSKKSGENADQNDKDDLALLQGATIETEGNKVLIRFTVPKEIALQMIQRKLGEQKLAPKAPNSTGMTKPADNSAKK